MHGDSTDTPGHDSQAKPAADRAPAEPLAPQSGGRSAKDAALERVAKTEAARFARLNLETGSIEQATVEPFVPENAGRSVNPAIEKVAKAEALRFARLAVETGSVEHATVEPFAPEKTVRGGKDPALEKVAKGGAAGVQAETEPSKVPGGEVASDGAVQRGRPGFRGRIARCRYLPAANGQRSGEDRTWPRAGERRTCIIAAGRKRRRFIASDSARNFARRSARCDDLASRSARGHTSLTRPGSRSQPAENDGRGPRPIS